MPLINSFTKNLDTSTIHNSIQHIKKYADIKDTQLLQNNIYRAIDNNENEDTITVTSTFNFYITFTM